MCPRRSKGEIGENPLSVWRHEVNFTLDIYKLQCRGSANTFDRVNIINECGVVDTSTQGQCCHTR